MERKKYKTWAKTKKVGNCKFELGDKESDVFYFGRNKNEIIDLLISFTRKECENCWKYQDKHIADMKRHFLSQIGEKLKAYA